jgi:hypothetical protein
MYLFLFFFRERFSISEIIIRWDIPNPLQEEEKEKNMMMVMTMMMVVMMMV